MSKLTWLASYPKSGNTWTRAFLAAYHFQLAGTDVLQRALEMTQSESRREEFVRVANKPEGDFNEQKIDSLRGAVQERLMRVVRPYQLIKTHNARIMRNGFPLICREHTRGAVYLVRNPLDVVDSYADHANLTIDGAIDLMSDPAHQIGNPQSGLVTQYLHTSSEHVLSWTQHQAFPVHLVRYEDLQSSPVDTFRGLIQFLGWELDENRLRRAIENSSFDSLRQTEESRGFAEQSGVAKSGRFFRQGKAGRWREVLTWDQVRRIVDHHGEVMEQLGFETSLEKLKSPVGNSSVGIDAGVGDLRSSEWLGRETGHSSCADVVPVGQLLQSALDRHQVGNLSEAKALYVAILETDPAHAEATHLLGVVCHQTGDPLRAVELIDQAVSLRPDNSVYHSNRAAARLAMSDLHHAEADYRKALEFDTTLADAHNGLAIVCNRSGRAEKAMEHFRLAIRYRPNFAEAHKNLGNALAKSGRVEEGIEHLRKAVALRPSFTEAKRSLAKWGKEAY